MSITIIICEVETMKEPLVITMAREYASGGSEIAQKVADPVSYTHLTLPTKLEV